MIRLLLLALLMAAPASAQIAIGRYPFASKVLTIPVGAAARLTPFAHVKPRLPARKPNAYRAMSGRSITAH
jgi:hypothetical protein